MQGQGRTPVVVDGALQESTVYRGYAGMAGRTYIDPDFLGGVSIEKGPSTAADATGAIGGIVRARTWQPDDIIAPDGTWGARLTFGLTGNNSDAPNAITLEGEESPTTSFDRPKFLDLRGHNASGIFAYRMGKVDFLAGVSRRDNGNYFAGTDGRDPSQWQSTDPFGYGEKVTSTSTDSKSLLLRSVIRPNSDHKIDLSYMRYQSDFGDMKPSQTMYGRARYQANTQVDAKTATARYSYDPDSPLVDLNVNLWGTRVESLTIDPVRIDYGDWIYNIDQFQATLSNRYGVTLDNTSRFGGKMGKVSLNYGLAFDREDFGPSDELARLAAEHERIYQRMLNGEIRTREGYRTQKSAFLNLEYKPADWATFTAGARYLHNVVQDSKAGTMKVQDGVINREDEEGWAPAVSALIEPLPGLQLYSRYAEALRAASPFEGTEGFTSMINPDEDLKMEHAHNTEVGFNLLKSGIFTQDDVLQAKLGWFNNSVTNYITQRQERIYANDGTYSDVNVVGNIPLVEMRGVEFNANYDMGLVWGEIGATEYSSVKTCVIPAVGRTQECIEGDVPMTNLSWNRDHIPPKRTISAVIGGRFFDEKLSVAGRYTKVTTETPYELFDVFGSYKMTDRAAISFAVDNVFDEYYVDALTRGRDGYNRQAAPGRTLRLSFVATLGDGHRDAGSSAEDRASTAAKQTMSAAALGPFNGDWSGSYAGILWGGTHIATEGETSTRIGANNSAARSESMDSSTNSMIGGLLYGYNRQTASGLVWGVEIDAVLDRARGDQAFLDPSYDNGRWGNSDAREASYHQKFGPSASLRLRLGKSFGRTLVYGTGGIGLIREKMTRTQYIGGANVTTPWASESDSTTRTGLLLGAGAEYAVNDHVSMKAEYLYGHYAASEFNYDLGGSSASAPTGSGRKVDNELESHSLRIGMNYRF
jgi:hemoglobin/transferrin/lactoferrin receptor protein